MVLVCTVIVAIAALAVAVTAIGRRLYRLKLEISVVACGLMYECKRSIDTHRPNLLESISLDYGTDPFKIGFWLWQKDYRPVVIIDDWDESDVGFIHDTFVKVVDKHKSMKTQRTPLRHTPVIHFRVEGVGEQ